MMDSDDSDPDAGLYESSDDEDYVPDGASGDDDDDDYTVNKSKSKPKGKPKGKKQQTKKVVQKPTRRSSRKRSGGICLREPDSDEESEEPLASSESEEEEEELEDANENYEHPEEQKKKIDDIWTSMKNNTDGKKKSKELTDHKVLEDDKGDTEKKESGGEGVGNIDESREEDDSKGVKADISKKELVDSKELVSDEISGETEKADNKSEAQSTGVGKRRSGGLSNVVGSLSKKQKLSTLDKSKLDWDSFKKDKGLEDELRNKSKDGYLSKQEFLQRVDYRTWENERELRLATGRGKK